MLLVSFVSNNLSNNERRHFKPFTNCHDSCTWYLMLSLLIRNISEGVPQVFHRVSHRCTFHRVSHRCTFHRVSHRYPTGVRSTGCPTGVRSTGCPTGIPQGVPQVYVPQGVPQVSHRCSTGCPTSYFKEYSEILKRMNHLNKMCKANKKNLKKKLGFSSNILFIFWL